MSLDAQAQQLNQCMSLSPNDCRWVTNRGGELGPKLGGKWPLIDKIPRLEVKRKGGVLESWGAGWQDPARSTTAGKRPEAAPAVWDLGFLARHLSKRHPTSPRHQDTILMHPGFLCDDSVVAALLLLFFQSKFLLYSVQFWNVG